MRIEELLKAIGPFVESCSYSEIAPLFLVCACGVKNRRIIRAVALSVAASGGNAVIVEGKRDEAFKAFDFCGAEGIFDICEYTDYYDVSFSSAAKRRRIARIKKCGKRNEISVGEISTFSF